MQPRRISSNFSIGKPPGLAVVFSISGGTAEISAVGHPFRAIAADIAGNFAAARREANQDSIFQVELFDQF